MSLFVTRENDRCMRDNKYPFQNLYQFWSTTFLAYSLYSREYYAYKDVWHLIFGDEREESNRYDRNGWWTCSIYLEEIGCETPAISKLSYSRCCDWKVHKPRCWVWPGYMCSVYFVFQDSRITTWFKKTLEKLDNSINVIVEKCVN